MIDNQEVIPEFAKKNEVIIPSVPEAVGLSETNQTRLPVENEDTRLGLRAEELALLRQSNTAKILDSKGFLIGLGQGNAQSTNPDGKNADELLGFLNKTK